MLRGLVPAALRAIPEPLPKGTTKPAAISLKGPATASVEAALGYARAVGAQRWRDTEQFLRELWRLGELAGYDPVIPAAMWAVETGGGTSEHWVWRLNPGGIGVTDHYDHGLGWDTGQEAACVMVGHLAAYVDGPEPPRALAECAAADPRYGLVLAAGMGGTVRTVADLGRGRWATDLLYGEKVAFRVDGIRRQGEPPRPTPAAPGQAPLPPGIVQAPSPNWHDRRGQPPLAIVYHVTDSDTAEQAVGWLRNPASGASSHVVIDRDGTIYQLVSSAKAAWTNGDYAPGFNRLIPWLAGAIGKCERGLANLNDYTITVEHAGRPGQAFTEEQVAASIALSRYWLDRYPTIRRNRGGMIRHADIAPVERSYCPGETFPLRRIIEACGGDPLSFAAA